ncbi:MAG: hypothetical protein C0497_15455 [Gemmatimonas sp.]|nr:hypothetical protein [Gemmatimonas sp.]
MARPALVRVGNLRLMAIPATLVRLSPTVFEKSPAVGRDDVADQITRTMRMAGYVVSKTNPFANTPVHSAHARVA